MLLERLEAQSSIGRAKLQNFAETASKRYKIYEIPKRNSDDTRTIEHPSKELKVIQRWLNRSFLRQLDVHSAATAYRRGTNILANASRHSKSNFTLRIDFKDFFPSFSAKGIRKFLLEDEQIKSLELSRADVAFFCKIVCRNEKLTIGAPTSPHLTNAMMFEFDMVMEKYCNLKGLIYTRYADDLFISGEDFASIVGVEDKVRRESLRFPYARLRINNTKTALLSRKYRRTITGLVITPDRKVSIGRDRKRMIKSLVHRFIIDDLQPEKVRELQGLLAFAMDCERKFFDSLCTKYSEDTIIKLMKL